MGRFSRTPQHLLRLFGVFLVVGVIVATGISLITHSGKKVRIKDMPREIEGPKVDKREKIEVVEFKKEKGNFSGRADRHYIGEDGLYHLEGNVQLTFFDRSEGEDVVLNGQTIIHDRDWTRFWLEGGASVVFKDFSLRSAALVYDAEEKRFSTDQGVMFQSESLSGTSRSCVYTQTQKKAELSGNVRLILRTERDFRGPVEVKADTFEYFLGKGKGRAEGRVMLGHGRSWARADNMHFKMAASREQMKSLVLEGKTALHLEGEFEKAESSNGQGVFILYPDIWEIRAKEIHLMGFVDEPRIQSVEAVKGCSLKFIAESGAFTQVESGRISFKLSRRGRLKELSAEKDVRISAESGEDGSLRALSGAGLQMQEDRMSITVEGRPEDPARFVFQRSDFTAERFVFSLKNKDFEAHKEIHAVLQQAEDQEEGTSGFFKRESPVFIQGESLRYAESEKRYVFKGKVKAWQGSRTLAADELSVERESGVLKARGRVTSVLFSRTGKKEEEQRFQIRAEKADYLAEEDRVVYEGGVRLDLKDGFLQTETLSLSLKGEGREVSHIAALGKVVVIQGRYEGRGGHAKFDIEQEMIVITENPVFIEKGKGQTQGTKLTFHMADGRIVIENRERERSTTVIKS